MLPAATAIVGTPTTLIIPFAVVGSQWGDEGKGKIVDWLSEKADVIVRFQGGHNAGHTLVVNNITSVSYTHLTLPTNREV